jgi:hypothetical protein
LRRSSAGGGIVLTSANHAQDGAAILATNPQITQMRAD